MTDAKSIELALFFFYTMLTGLAVTLVVFAVIIYGLIFVKKLFKKSKHDL